MCVCPSKGSHAVGNGDWLVRGCCHAAAAAVPGSVYWTWNVVHRVKPVGLLLTSFIAGSFRSSHVSRRVNAQRESVAIWWQWKDVMRTSVYRCRHRQRWHHRNQPTTTIEWQTCDIHVKIITQQCEPFILTITIACYAWKLAKNWESTGNLSYNALFFRTALIPEMFLLHNRLAHQYLKLFLSHKWLKTYWISNSYLWYRLLCNTSNLLTF